MPLSQSVGLRLASSAIATTCIAFGVNAILRPDHALTFFEFRPPSAREDKLIVDSLMAIYGVRDIFMGAAILAASHLGTHSALGWILIATSGVALADGLVCWNNGQGEWNHWGYALVAAVIGSLSLGIFD
ncbi:uncharacterized protein N7529_011013 [Penicillium soppii]|uniref:uncharacterized protein n=1 Tax=Penicillium soppii TaxID=69789 RepID=UPI0025496876|nr:uncharacterized protein N7529_011013 [Penicillium soppii]KAJ5851628.1 hypothetical protein N7529_011013 [Penicillium soppii]